MGVVGDHREVMGDQNDGQVSLNLNIGKKVTEKLFPRGIDPGRRLIQEQDLWIPLQGYGQKDSLQFPAG